MLSSRFEDPQIESPESYFPTKINGWSMAWAQTNGELLWFAKRGREYRDGIIEEGAYAFLPDELEEIVAYQLTDPLTVDELLDYALGMESKRNSVLELMLLADQAEQLHWRISRTGPHYRPVAEVTRQVNAEIAP